MARAVPRIALLFGDRAAPTCGVACVRVVAEGLVRFTLRECAVDIATYRLQNPALDPAGADAAEVGGITRPTAPKQA